MGGVVDVAKKIGANAIMCCGHKEYALPSGRKDDPTFDMNEFRFQVAAIMAGTAPLPSVIPAVDSAGRPTVRRGDTGELIKAIQTKLGIGGSGMYDGPTEATVRQFQRKHNLVPDGIAGPRTWSTLEAPEATSLLRAPATGIVDQIARIAASSPAATISWKNRGVAPLGYIKGMALCFARACTRLKAGDAAVTGMAPDKINAVVLHALGGAGKSALLRTFANELLAAGGGGAARIHGWSAYSQGSGEQKRSDADGFFSKALVDLDQCR